MLNELLQGLTPGESDRVLALGKRIRVSAGAPLFQLGDPAQYLYLIESGQIRLTLPMQIRGREENVLIEEKAAGETVGWSALIPPYQFTLTATASVDAEAIALSRDVLTSFLENSPEVGSKLCLNLALVIGHRLQTLQTMWLREMQRTVELHAAAV